MNSLHLTDDLIFYPQSRRKMKQGPVRDRLLYEEKTALMFKSKLDEYKEEEDLDQEEGRVRAGVTAVAGGAATPIPAAR